MLKKGAEKPLLFYNLSLKTTGLVFITASSIPRAISAGDVGEAEVKASYIDVLRSGLSLNKRIPWTLSPQKLII